MTIKIGSIYTSTCDESPLKGFYRVLQIIHSEDIAVLIKVPTEHCKREGAKQRNYYVRGFISRSYEDVMLWEDQKLIVEVQLTFPPILCMSDDAIREKYPPKKCGEESYWIASRELKWDLIKPILPDDNKMPTKNLMELENRAGLRAAEAKVSKGNVLDALHRYFAFGSVKNALLPNMTACGAPGKPRIAKKGIKLGRKNASAVVGNIELQGKILTEQDRDNLVSGWMMYMRKGAKVHDAFIAMSQVFYNVGYKLINGKHAAILLDAHLRPTEREFCYHGPLSKLDSAIRRIMGEGEWLKNFRELLGSARTGIFAFGQLGSIDASPIDVNLVSCFDRLFPIGVSRGVFVKDTFCDLIVGWHIAIAGVGAKDANLAILCAATSKKEILERYGLKDIPADDFPCIFFSKYISDNGELRSEEGINANVEQLGSRIEFISSCRPDKNPVSEAGHHSRNAGLNHQLEGTTKGRQKKRGEPLPISKALLSHYQYMRLLLKWIHWKNAKQQVPRLLTTEMRRDNVEPTRIAIYRWALVKGYVSGKPVDPTLLKAHLLPTYTASIKRNGLTLHRPKPGKEIELLKGALFNDIYLATSGIIRNAVDGGNKYLEVKADPNDLSCVYYFDENGIHRIKNVKNDYLLDTEGCLSDLGAMNDVDRLKKIESASQTDQDESDVRSLRIEEEEDARRKKRQAKAETQNGTSQKTDRQSVRENQEHEKRAQLDQAAERARDLHANEATAAHPLQDRIDEPPKTQETEQPVVGSMSALMQTKLNSLHNQRSV